MGISDDKFREVFKPLQVPAHYNADDSDENKIIYALARIGEGGADDVALELVNTDPALDRERFTSIAASVLNDLYDKGLISGYNSKGGMFYNLNKITHANDGTVDPDLLAPGLD